MQTAIVITFADGEQCCVRINGQHLDDDKVFVDMRDRAWHVWTPLELIGGVQLEIRKED